MKYIASLSKNTEWVVRKNYILVSVVELLNLKCDGLHLPESDWDTHHHSHWLNWKYFILKDKNLVAMDMPLKKGSDLYDSVICLFYYLITYSDEKASQVEISLMDKIAKIENFDMSQFEHQLLVYNQNDRATVFNKCISDLKQLEDHEQIRILAWMFVVSDSDDDFNEKEWNVIQETLNILELPLSQILAAERNLNKLLIRSNP